MKPATGPTYSARTSQVLKKTFYGFVADDCTTQAAALALYAIFSLPPLLLTITIFAGNIWGENLIQGQIETALNSLIGETGTNQLVTMMRDISFNKSGWLTYLGSYIALFIGATGVMMQLQSALNRIWTNTEPEKQMTIGYYLLKRAFSLLIILASAILLILSLIVSTVLTWFSKFAEPLVPNQIIDFTSAIPTTVTLLLSTMIIAMVFSWLPDNPKRRKDIYRGAFITAILITIGKEVFAVYLATFNNSSGSASTAFVSLILWIYYSCLILLFGAELTKFWSLDKQEARERLATSPTTEDQQKA